MDVILSVGREVAEVEGPAVALRSLSKKRSEGPAFVFSYFWMDSILWPTAVAGAPIPPDTPTVDLALSAVFPHLKKARNARLRGSPQEAAPEFVNPPFPIVLNLNEIELASACGELFLPGAEYW